MSDVSAAMAAAAAEDVCPRPTPETAVANQVAARAPTAAAAAALGRALAEPADSTLRTPPVAHAAAASVQDARGRDGAVDPRAEVGGRRGGRAAREVGGTSRVSGYSIAANGGIGRPVSAEGRKRRTSIPLGEKSALIDFGDAGHTWSEARSCFV